MNDFITFYLIIVILILAVVIAAVGTMKYGNPQNKRKSK